MTFANQNRVVAWQADKDELGRLAQQASYLVCKIATPSQSSGGGLALASMRSLHSSQKTVMSVLFTFRGHELSASSAPFQSYAALRRHIGSSDA